MTKEELAKALDGCQYREELKEIDLEEVKTSRLVIVHGASDDIMQLDGRFNEECDCYEGARFLIDKDGLIYRPEEGLAGWGDGEFNNPDLETEWEAYFIRRKYGHKLEAVWDQEGYSWIYKTKIPHSVFDVLEDDEPYCRGIVIDLKQEWGMP